MVAVYQYFGHAESLDLSILHMLLRQIPRQTVSGALLLEINNLMLPDRLMPLIENVFMNYGL